MSDKEKLEKMTGTKLTTSEYEFIKQIAEEKKWSVAQALREIVREKMNSDTKSTISEKIDTLFYQGYFDEFLEDLAENQPELFQEYTNSQEAIACP